MNLSTLSQSSEYFLFEEGYLQVMRAQKILFIPQQKSQFMLSVRNFLPGPKNMKKFGSIGYEPRYNTKIKIKNP